MKKYLDKVFIKKKVVLKASKNELICILPFIGNKQNVVVRGSAVRNNLFGSYYAGPRWRYFLWYGVKRAGVIYL